jgi:hypothetical protein
MRDIQITVQQEMQHICTQGTTISADNMETEILQYHFRLQHGRQITHQHVASGNGLGCCNQSTVRGRSS